MQHYSINHKGNLTITLLDINTSKEPYQQYLNPEVFDKDQTLAKASGRHTKAREFREKLSITLYDLAAKSTIRSVNMVITITTEEKKRCVIRTNLQMIATPQLLTLLFPRQPMTFLKTLALIEEKYAEEPDVDYKPWLRRYFEEKTETTTINTWADLQAAIPDLFKN